MTAPFGFGGSRKGGGPLPKKDRRSELNISPEAARDSAEANLKNYHEAHRAASASGTSPEARKVLHAEADSSLSRAQRFAERAKKK